MSMVSRRLPVAPSTTNHRTPNQRASTAVRRQPRDAPYSVPGVTLSAVEALTAGQEAYSSAQVAYLIGLSYEIGRRHTLAEDLAETIANWDEHTLDDGRCTVVRPALRSAVRNVRDRRKAARLAEYERLSGTPRFAGGLPSPRSTYPDEGRRPPKFPTLAEQAEWLSAADIAYLRQYAREENQTRWQRRPTQIGVAA
jgi:hypothetical protein